MNRIFTIGYSTHTLDDFIRLLRKFDVSATLDVRSNPYSQFTPQFNKASIQHALNQVDISYEFAGELLGARSPDPSVYVSGSVDFGALSVSDPYRQGINRISEVSDDQNVAIICTEKDPIACHRGVLITRSLVEGGFDVEHILGSGELESHSDMEDRMVIESGLPYATLFDDHQEIVKQAYSIIGHNIAWKDPEYIEPNESYLGQH